MYLKEREDFTPKKEHGTFSKRGKTKVIDKDLFTGKFFSFVFFSNVIARVGTMLNYNKRFI